MNTILTDDEIATAIAHLYAGPEVLAMALPDELHSARAVEAAVLAKLAQQEPVAWQVRLRCKANKNQAWSSWSECDERAAKAYQASTDVQWEYETRALYTHPAPQQADRQRVPDSWRDAVKVARHCLEGWANQGAWVWPESALEQCKKNTTEALTILAQIDTPLAAAPEAPAKAKPCLVKGDCKHDNWCSETYCQEHCQFVKSAQASAVDERDRKDAERYRFIRDADRSDKLVPFDTLLSYACESLDEAIDEAMGLESRAALAQKGGE